MEPGFFRTKVLRPDQMKVETTPVGAYTEMNKVMRAGVAAIDGNQPGDPQKGVERLIDVVRSKGLAMGKEMPKRLPLGPDGLAVVREKCLETLRICEEWGNLISNTDF